MTTVTVRPATATDAGPLIAVLAEAFHHGPVADWLVPDPDGRRSVYYRYFADAFDHALTHGKVYTTSDQSAAAIWYPRLHPTPARPRTRDKQLEAIAGIHAERFMLLEQILAAYHPAEAHHYLAYIAVDPARQNHGIGAALLTDHHRHLDHLALPAYLEATNPRNRQLYLRRGYTTGPTLTLPAGGPTIWRMWRGTTTPTGSRTAFPPARTGRTSRRSL
ncbi:GNAT family N-acetyltransferase [Micromonospora sp. FIMYZ51]|uniref:GNAT family N-acetyltransferase n=1 Tax=Micromonospora sp. FIMYZ51 TaxID=3051832 RepID=UPI00311F85D1